MPQGAVAAVNISLCLMDEDRAAHEAALAFLDSCVDEGQDFSSLCGLQHADLDVLRHASPHPAVGSAAPRVRSLTHSLLNQLPLQRHLTKLPAPPASVSQWSNSRCNQLMATPRCLSSRRASWRSGHPSRSARKKYGIEYPQMYAEQSDKNAKAFNCVQRAHQNVLEQLPVFFTLLFASAPFRPGVAAVAGVVRIAGFIFFVRGYATGNPKKRMQGSFGYLGFLVSLGLSIEAGLRITGAI